ncbi:MAG TPA: hypothetical protein VN969_24445 [Streptosporangiaceae bacterium]|jgi:hypothetical protein|nr:hypothetical protein [Streptosporangiaceae bacterium]
MPYRIRVPGMEIGSFRQHLAADGKVTKTIRLYTEAVAWSAAAPLIGEVRKTNWEQAGQQDVREWMAWLFGSYNDAYRLQSVPGAGRRTSNLRGTPMRPHPRQRPLVIGRESGRRRGGPAPAGGAGMTEMAAHPSCSTQRGRA